MEICISAVMIFLTRRSLDVLQGKTRDDGLGVWGESNRGMTGVVCFLLKMGEFCDKMGYVFRKMRQKWVK